jgi:hypothetical protein
MSHRIADTAAAGSAFLAGSAWIADVEPFITAAAGIVAIAAGAFAAWYHFERAMKMRKDRLDED